MIGDNGGRKKRQMVPAGAPPWMATFADLATLLLSFFVLILSFSEMDVHKYKQVAGSMRQAFGVQRTEFAMDTPKGTSFVMREFAPGRPTPVPIETLRHRMKTPPQAFSNSMGQGYAGDTEGARQQRIDAQARRDQRRDEADKDFRRIRAILRNEIERGLVEVKQAGSRITIRIRERGSFPSGSAELIEPFTPVIRKIGRAIRLTSGRVVVAGHTDNVPINTASFRSNWELSASRAATLVHRLDELSPVDPERITIEGHADTEPLVPNDSVLNRARNRRVEVVLVTGQAVGDTRSVDDILLEDGDGEGGQ